MFTSMLVIQIPWSPNIFTLGGFVLTWHGLFTALGILAGVQLALAMGRIVRYDPDQAYTLALVGVPSGIIGARTLFVIEHWDYYSQSVGEILALNEGGISVWGAVIGGVLGAWLFALWRKYPVARGLDIAAFGLLIGLGIGRLGDLVNGEHLARATELPWAVVYTHPLSPAFAHSITAGPHHPATTYEMLVLFGLIGVLYALMRGPLREKPGLTFCVFFVSYSLLRFALTYLRLDSDEVAGWGLRTPQLVALLSIAAAIPMIVYFATRPRQPIEGGGEPSSTPRTPPAGRIPVERRG